MTKKTTPIPPGYKQTKIGVLPVEWEVVKLKEIVSKIESGTSVNCSPDSKSSKRILKTSAVTLGSFSPSETKIPLEEEEDHLSTKAKIGHVLVCRKNSPTLVGNSVLVDYLEQDLYLPDLLWQLIPNQEHRDISTFLFYAINERHTEFRIRNLANGSSESMRNISKGSYLNLSIPLPPLPQQQKIAQILSTWDHAITTQTQLINTKKEQKRGLMQRLLTGEVRLPGFEGEWKSQRFRKLFEPHSEKAREREFEVLSVTKDGIIAQSQYFNKEIASRDTSPYRVVRKGQLAMSGLNFWMGAIDILTKFDSGIISPAYKVFKVNYDILAPNYAIYLVRSRIMVKVLVGASVQGASIVRRNLDKNMLHSSKILTPPLPEQTAIAKILTTADREIHLLETRLTELHEQKRGLMQRLLTGAVRVTPDA